ncbi:MAG: flagellar biosynthetic protein FliO [Myxococcota bacterium]|nr:flagellar biosynthetic protein FliO [Myxococcota bacterium]MDW8362764.1 flagellar biosynthetic protein FliO [Myxococcales bacterium]
MPAWLQAPAPQPPSLPGGYGLALLQSLLALAAICILAWVVLRWSAQRRLFGAGAAARIRVLERVFLDGRRVLYLVRVGDRTLLLGAGESGPPAVLATLEGVEDLTVPAPVPPRRFGDVLRAFGGRKTETNAGAAHDAREEA